MCGFFGGDITTWENEKREEKRELARWRKEEHVKDMMGKVTAVPEGVKAWLTSAVFPEDYIFYTKNGRMYTWACTACGAAGQGREKMSHNMMTVCSGCGKRLQAKGRVKQIDRKENIIILQGFLQDKWIERQFTAACTWKGTERHIRMYEEIRAVIPKGKTRGKVWYGQYCMADEHGQEWWDTNTGMKRFKRSLLYPEMDGAITGALERSGMDIMARTGTRFNVDGFVTSFEAYPWLAHLIRQGLTNLAADAVDIYGGNWSFLRPAWISGDASNAQEALMIDGNRLDRLKRINGHLAALEWLAEEQKTGKKIPQEILAYLDENRIYPDSCRGITKRTGNVTKMAGYLRKQKLKPDKVLRLWEDYLAMAEREGMDTADDIIRYPKELKGRHDALVREITARRDAERTARMQAVYDLTDQRISRWDAVIGMMHMDAGRYFVMPAECCSDLIREGQALHHCVGASNVYMERMADGKTWILFLRRKSAPGVPWYTAEIDMREYRILQAYSEYDRKPDGENVGRILKQLQKKLRAAD